MIEVQTSEGNVELGDEDRSLLRAVLREVNEASYLLEDEVTWSGFPELLSAVRDERTFPDTRVVIGAEQMKNLRELADPTCKHLGADEFRTRTGFPLREAQRMLHRLGDDS